MNATVAELDIQIDPELNPDGLLGSALRHAGDYFRAEYSELPAEEEVTGATLRWTAPVNHPAGNTQVIARFVEHYRDRQSATILKPIALRHVMNGLDCEMEMRSLLRSVIQLRLKIVDERKRRLLQQLHAEEEQEYAV
jgi:hypothetical protein